MRKIILLITIGLLIVGCQKNTDSTSVETHEDEMNLNNILDGKEMSLATFVATYSKDKLYFLDYGGIIEYDFKTKKAKEILHLSYRDNTPFYGVGYAEPNVKGKYVNGTYLQYLDGHLYYIMSSYVVNDPDKDEKGMLFKYSLKDKTETLVYNTHEYVSKPIVSEDYFFYTSLLDLKHRVIDFNTNKSQTTPITNGYPIKDFMHSETEVFMSIADLENDEKQIHRFDYDTLEKDLIHKSEYSYNRTFNNNKVISVSDVLENYYISTLSERNPLKIKDNIIHMTDDNYIYISTKTVPRVYEVYDYDFELKYSVRSPIKFKLSSLISESYNRGSTLSPILGVVDDRLFVIGFNGTSYECYLVDYKTNDWELIYMTKNMEDIRNAH